MISWESAECFRCSILTVAVPVSLGVFISLVARGWLRSSLECRWNLLKDFVCERMLVFVRVDETGDTFEVKTSLANIAHLLECLLNHRLRCVCKLVDQKGFLGIWLASFGHVFFGKQKSLLVDLFFFCLHYFLFSLLWNCSSVSELQPFKHIRATATEAIGTFVWA